MTNWKKVYIASRDDIRAHAASGLFVTAVYVMIGILGLFLLSSNQPFEAPLGVLFVAIGVIGGGYLGTQAYREYFGDPLVLTLRVLRKQDAMSYTRTGTLHRFFIQAEISKAVNLAADGKLTPTQRARWDAVAVSESLYKALTEGETVALVCTPTGRAFATVEDMAQRG
jgi:hypothetical protein